MHLDHINIVVPDLDTTVAFFEKVLDLQTGDRPPFPSTGAWMYDSGGKHPIVHLVENTDDDRRGPTGAIDHVAFQGTDATALKKRLDDNGIAYDSRNVPLTDMHQVFFMAPFQIKIEVNFPAADA